jgi:hypothetical protein
MRWEFEFELGLGLVDLTLDLEETSRHSLSAICLRVEGLSPLPSLDRNPRSVEEAISHAQPLLKPGWNRSK